jgi:DNA-directed RNA polymerase subunit RPC12/RpoP
LHSGWIVEHECPQCGAPVARAETDRILSCEHCRVRLYLAPQKCFRYVLAPRAVPVQDVLFAPYWRFRGSAFSCGEKGIDYRVLDTTLPANSADFLPPTLGLRPQAMRLTMLTPNAAVRFLTVHSSLDALLDRAGTWNRVARPPARGRCFFREFIGETISLIYLPLVWRSGAVLDAVLDRPLARLPESDAGDFTAGAEAASWRMDVVPTLCPRCGWDLTGERDSCVLLCDNCSLAWEVSDGAFSPVSVTVVPFAGDTVVYLPFWEMSADVAGLEVDSCAALARLANLPRIIPAAWEKRPAAFWSPAFKIQPKIFLRLLQQLTSLQLDRGADCGWQGRRLYPVTLPAGEAAQTIRLTLAEMACDAKRVLPRLASVTTQVRTTRLWYLPFKAGPHELVHCHTGLGISRVALGYGRKL